MKKIASFLLVAIICIIGFLGSTDDTMAEAAAKPEIVIDSYRLSDDFVLGEETVLDVTFKNMSDDFNCSSLLITYTSANQSVIPSVGHSNQMFINSLNAGQKETVHIPVVIIDRGDGYGTVTFNVEYAIDNITEGIAESIRANIKENIKEYITQVNEEENSESILINVPGSIRESISEDISGYIAEKMAERFARYRLEDIRTYSLSSYIVFPIADESVTIRNVNVTTETTIGANSLVSVSFENQLKTDLTNANLVISGDVNEGEISYQIGNVTGRSTKYAEYYLNFSSEGQKSIKLQLKYTLDNGDEITKDVGEYIINVKEGISKTVSNISLSTEEMQQLQNQTGSVFNLSTLFFVLGGLMLIVAAVVLVIYLVKRKND